MKKIYPKIKKILTDPSRFFEETRKEKQKESMDFLKLSALIPSIFAGLATLFVGISVMAPILGTAYAAMISVMTAIFTVIYVYVLFVAIVWVSAIMFHLYLRLFKAKGSLVDTKRVVIYSSTPSYLLGGLMFVPWQTISYSSMILATVFGTYLTIIGLSKQHALSMKSAAIAVLIPTIVLSIAAVYPLLWF